MPMVKNPFNGQLNSNEIFSGIFNQIISQDFYGGRLSGLDSSLVSKFRVDGTLYGDTKLFYAADLLKTYAWGNYNEAANLLNTYKPADPKCQAITINKFRQIPLTLDQYLSKRAWSSEGAFSSFHSIMQSYIQKTKKLYDTMLVNAYVGTIESAATNHTVTIDVTTAVGSATGEEANRLEAQSIARGIANLIDDMKDATRDYNDYKYIDAYNPSDLIVVWNNEIVNKLTKLDMPTIFHKEGLVDKFAEEKLQARFFGHVETTGGVVGTTSGLTAGKVRSLIETDYTVSGTVTHVYPGDVIPTGATVGANVAYVVCDNIICKVLHKDAIKYMSAFETATEFFNAKSLSTNYYLTFGYSEPDYLRALPVITVEKE